MKTIGLIGGMSWESTQHYYRLINEGVSRRLGGLHSARLLLHSVDFGPIAEMQVAGRWGEAADVLAAAAVSLERAGADFLLICANTMHRVAPQVAGAVSIPLLHILDPTAAALTAARLQRVGLLGTAFTMEEPAYRQRLERAGLTVLTPAPEDRALVHRVIYEELCRGSVVDGSRAAFQRIVAALVAAGAEGVILGCTELGMLLAERDLAVPSFDTTTLHAAAAVEMALG
jgi:aspartate racemase